MMNLFTITVSFLTVIHLTTGFPSPRIVGGAIVGKGTRPYQAHIRKPYLYSNGEVAALWGCGGAIISEYWILTAAHCVQSPQDKTKTLDPSALLIRVGQHDTTLSESHANNYAVRDVFVHPDYDPTSFANDIALIRTDRINFAKYVQPIKLPALLDQPVPNRTVTVSGWGSGFYGSIGSTKLRSVSLQIVPTDLCNTKESYNGKVLEGMFCAAADGKSSCGGDSGGPVTWKCQGGMGGCVKGEDMLGGLVSWAMLCAHQNYPSVFVDVVYYLTWVYGIIDARAFSRVL